MAAVDVPDLRGLQRAVVAARGGHFGAVRVTPSSVPAPAVSSVLPSRRGLLDRLRRR